MGHQHQQKPDTGQARHPATVPQVMASHENPAGVLALSPATIMKLQRTIGNQAVQRLLAHNQDNVINRDPEPQNHTPSITTLPRDVLSDIPLGSPEWYVHVRTRVKGSISSWLTASLYEINEFVDDMQEDGADKSARISWTDAFQA